LRPICSLIEQNVQICLKTNRQRGMGRIVMVGLMLALWLGTVALAVSPELHQRLHKDSKSVTHECLVTLLSKSHLLAGGAGSFVLALVPLFFGWLVMAETSWLSVPDYRLSPSRAPPSILSSNTVVG
jgi:multisubunit Na+/H+ antiporter MnhG subunit